MLDNSNTPQKRTRNLAPKSVPRISERGGQFEGLFTWYWVTVAHVSSSSQTFIENSVITIDNDPGEG
jgi:hypothetical protein